MSNPAVADVLWVIQTEKVSAEAGRGGVVAEIGLDGRLRGLEIRSRHAAESVPVDLAEGIGFAIREGEEAAERRRVELVGGLNDGTSYEERFERNLDRLRQTMANLRTRLPGARA